MVNTLNIFETIQINTLTISSLFPLRYTSIYIIICTDVYFQKIKYEFIFQSICTIKLCNKLSWPPIKYNALLAKTVGQSVKLHLYCDCQGVRERG